MKKKVGIITLPLIDNFGGMLQAIALYNFLEGKGLSVVHLRNETIRKGWRLPFAIALEKIPFQNVKNFRYFYKKRKYHEAFLSKWISNRTKPLRVISDFGKIALSENFDAIIVGSDQVWRWDYIKDFYEIYFLSFCRLVNTKKISYAASFGTSEWTALDKKLEITGFLSDFNAVSVREQSGIDICRNLGIYNVTQVVDPTLLMHRSFYENLIGEKTGNKSNKILLTYILDESVAKYNLAVKMLDEFGDGFVLNKLALNADLKIPDWLLAFKNADYVLTDSFHGMVFSIIFNKKFTVIANCERGINRFESLLKILDLESRMVIEDNIDRLDFCENEIDYIKINNKLDSLKAFSEGFIIDALG